MNRSISVATFVSIVLHGAVLIFLLANRDRLVDAGAPTLIKVTFWEQDDYQQAGAETVEPVAESDAPSATAVAPAPGAAIPPAPAAEEAIDSAGVVAAATPTQPPPTAAVEPAPAPEPAAVETEAADEGAAPAQADLLATIQPAEHQVPAPAESPAAAPERMPMSSEQRRMLSKKISKWSQTYSRMAPAESGLSWEYQGREYRAAFSPEPAADEMDMEHVWVEISTEEAGRRLSTRMRMKRLAFSNFAQFVDRWDPEVQIHDDELDGRFHVNSTMNLNASSEAQPRFLGKVTTASSRGIDTTRSEGRIRRDEIFLGGLETAVGKIILPQHFLPFPADEEVDPRQLRFFDEHTRVTFYADGTYGWKVVDSAVGEAIERIPADRALYLVGARKKKLYLSGSLRGRVLVYSPERIVITGNLTYARDPHALPKAGDYLGLVCDKTVEVAHPRISGDGDLDIHAAIYARRRFQVSGYRLRHYDKLTIYGSLTAGTLTATEPRFATRILFDRRLEDTRPPGFPLSDRYEFDPWDEEWEVETAAVDVPAEEF